MGLLHGKEQELLFPRASPEPMGIQFHYILKITVQLMKDK